mmetsp:Transcript_9337/g.13703  ORF Transcript_9337/g.13703 Transcript_9337/m.13703 type:complete len:860 (-) Transcript_9337:64-2643(-)|eukprot:CAMPEP_0194033944 /NCGR_PEP_ID=MMETSP0009_2-20130614/6410_1 /TAXON_ID=210454 /ORGANISM="Grammatophora oceanica, Strain CCMP 410" /LENGTH=859 /DNA_ID=CAMNT_0038674677 /DNA_START=278 /DNA_END=2857 /DNA_ORIENTATION=+
METQRSRNSRSFDDAPLESRAPPSRASFDEDDGGGLRSKPHSWDNSELGSPSAANDDASVNSETFPAADPSDARPGHSSLGNLPIDTNVPAGALGAALNDPHIDDNTPAAEALRANAEVSVRKINKLARSIHVQSVRKIVKKATFRAKSGNVRGKPPRVPPTHPDGINTSSTNNNNNMFVVPEDPEEELIDDISDDSSSFGSNDPEAQANTQVVEIQGSTHEFIIENEELKAKTKKSSKKVLDDVEREVAAGANEAANKILQANDPHDLLQSQQTKRRKKKGKNKDARKSYVKGKVIDGQHELYALSIAVMLGVRTSIGNTNALMSGPEGHRWLNAADFRSTQKYEFRPSGGDITPPHQLGHTFKFKDYSPVAFAYLRRMFGINEFDFILSVCGDANFIEFISNAKSGQFFFYSRDGKYMVKTMTNAESKFLRKILPDYFRHCSRNPNTFMTKFLGMYRVKLYHLRRNVKFVIMNSVYYTDKFLQLFYDLKGSVTGRNARPNEDVKKDNDLRRGLPDSAIAMRPETRERVRQQLQNDVEFMSSMHIMDYSMLVGIHHVPPKQGADKAIGRSGFNFSAGREGSLRLRDLVNSKRNVKSSRDERDMQHPPSPSDHDLMGSKDENSIIGNGSRHSESSSKLLFGEFDEDDDNSYLEGSEAYNRSKAAAGERRLLRTDSLQRKKEQTTEKLFWPYHRFWDINGSRRMTPYQCKKCGKPVPCSCTEMPDDPLRLFDIRDFEPPLSDRKDKGIEMDTTGFSMPMQFKAPNGAPHVYEGKIFYMGIIDVLQQYNVRKRLEANYRRFQGSGWRDASCVHPKVYADRFLEFFDQYSQRDPDMTNLHPEENVIMFTKRDASYSNSSYTA